MKRSLLIFSILLLGYNANYAQNAYELTEKGKEEMKLKMYEEAVISFTSAIHLDEAMVVEHIKKVKDYMALD